MFRSFCALWFLKDALVPEVFKGFRVFACRALGRFSLLGFGVLGFSV